MRTHASYLVGRDIKWRKNGQRMRIDHRPFSPGSAHSILGEGFGSTNSVLLISQERFHSWVAQAQGKVDRTAFGKWNNSQGKRNYHSWEEHLLERHGEE